MRAHVCACICKRVFISVYNSVCTHMYTHMYTNMYIGRRGMMRSGVKRMPREKHRNGDAGFVLPLFLSIYFLL